MATENRDGSRTYGVIGCVTILLLPLSFLASLAGGTLTWSKAAAHIGLCVLLLAVPLFLAGRRRGDD